MGYEVSYWGGAPIPQYMVVFNPLTGQMDKHCRCRPLRARGPILGMGG